MTRIPDARITENFVCPRREGERERAEENRRKLPNALVVSICVR